MAEALKTGSLEEVKQTVAGEPAVLLYFYNNQCPPCLALRPRVEKLIETQFPKMKLVWVDSAAVPEIPAAYGVFANPALLLFFDGREYRRFSKYISVDELSAAIQRYYGLIFDE